MTATTLDNVNFKILLAQHGGNFARAKAAWDQILGLGGYGNVPHEYAGGLDVRGLRVLADERSQKQYQAEVMTYYKGEPVPLPAPCDDLEDRIKKIEALASGDKPRKRR